MEAINIDSSHNKCRGILILVPWESMGMWLLHKSNGWEPEGEGGLRSGIKHNAHKLEHHQILRLLAS